MRSRVGGLGWGGGVGDRVLSAILALAIVGALGMLVYTVANPRVGERFTEFYLLGLKGQAGDYPAVLRVGEEGRVVVGIINREQRAMTYRVEVRIDGILVAETVAVTLEHGEKWQETVGFTPAKAGDKQKVEFLLYQPGQGEAYQQLHLWLDVR